MSWVFLRTDVLRNVHDRLLKRFGGLPGVRDAGALDSAVARPRNLLEYRGIESGAALAAALPWAILRNHPFADGNKRTALAALVMFVELNGLRLTCTEVEETAMVLRAAAGEINEEEWTAWVGRVVAPAEG